MISSYNSKEMTLTVSGKSYYFYTGSSSFDAEAEFVSKLLARGFVPNYREELVEMYLELKALKALTQPC